MTESTNSAAVLAGERAEVRRAVELIGQLLLGSVSERSTLEGFLHSNLGKSGSNVVCESRKLSSIGHVTVGLVLADLIDRFDPAIGPGDDDQPPTWGHVKIGEDELAAPSALSIYFPAAEIAPAPVVVRLCENHSFDDGPLLLVFTLAEDRAHGVAVIERIISESEGARNLFRGRALAASSNHGTLVLEVVESPVVARDDGQRHERVEKVAHCTRVEPEVAGQCFGIGRPCGEPREKAEFDGRKEGLGTPESEPDPEQVVRRGGGHGRCSEGGRG